MNHIMLIGIQGSGKGTQARKILEKNPDFVLFEMGPELKRYAQTWAPGWKEIMNAIESGLKVDTPYIVMMAQAFLEKNKDKVILMDSVIRSQEQNEALEPLFWEFHVIFLDLDEETAVARLSGRRVDPITFETFPSSFDWVTNPKTGNKLIVRAEDTPDAIRKRIAWSKGDTLPLIEVWKRHGHRVHRIDAADSEGVVFKQIEKILEQ